MTSRPGTRALYSTGSLAVIVVLLAAACSSTSSGGQAAPPGKGPAILGGTHVASGSPLKVGYVYDGTSQALDQTDNLESAQATVTYVNTYLNGIGGHPLSLDVCSTGATPSGGRNCVTQLVTDKVPIVLNSESAEGNVVFPALVSAGIPVWLDLGGTQALDSSKLAYIVQNPLMTGLGGPALVASQAGVKSAAIAVIDVPAAMEGLPAGAPLLYGYFNVETNLIAIPPGTPDPSPQVDAALSKHPGQFMVIGDQNLCDTVLKALQNADYKGQIVALAGCIGTAAAKELTNLNGVMEFTTQTTDPASKELKVFNAVMDRYAPSNIDRSVAKSDYQMIVALSLATEGLKGPATTQSLQHAINTMPSEPLPLAPGVHFRCHHNLSAFIPAACSGDVIKTTLNSDGSVATSAIIHGTALGL
jgi:branched-chain amino acid transport system substrate-binding protein